MGMDLYLVSWKTITPTQVCHVSRWDVKSCCLLVPGQASANTDGQAARKSAHGVCVNSCLWLVTGMLAASKVVCEALKMLL